MTDEVITKALSMRLTRHSAPRVNIDRPCPMHSGKRILYAIFDLRNMDVKINVWVSYVIDAATQAV